jgi:hypothetical protein
MYRSILKLRFPFTILVVLATLGTTILQAQNLGKPAKTTGLLWSVSVPAGTYPLNLGQWKGPLTHFTLSRTIRLIEMDYDTEQLPFVWGSSPEENGGPCNGEIGLFEPSPETVPLRETSLQLSTLTPTPFGSPEGPIYSGYMATLDLRGKDVVFQAGTKLWLYLAAQYPGCNLPSSGNVTIEYEIVR